MYSTYDAGHGRLWKTGWISISVKAEHKDIVTILILAARTHPGIKEIRQQTRRMPRHSFVCTDTTTILGRNAAAILTGYNYFSHILNFTDSTVPTIAMAPPSIKIPVRNRPQSRLWTSHRRRFRLHTNERRRRNVPRRRHALCSTQRENDFY